MELLETYIWYDSARTRTACSIFRRYTTTSAATISAEFSLGFKQDSSEPAKDKQIKDRSRCAAAQRSEQAPGRRRVCRNIVHSRIVVVHPYSALDGNGCSGNLADHAVHDLAYSLWVLPRKTPRAGQKTVHRERAKVKGWTEDGRKKIESETR